MIPLQSSRGSSWEGSMMVSAPPDLRCHLSSGLQQPRGKQTVRNEILALRDVGSEIPSVPWKVLEMYLSLQEGNRKQKHWKCGGDAPLSAAADCPGAAEWDAVSQLCRLSVLLKLRSSVKVNSSFYSSGMKLQKYRDGIYWNLCNGIAMAEPHFKTRRAADRLLSSVLGEEEKHH